MIKRFGLFLLCLLIAGCTAVGKTPTPAPATFAGLTVEEHALAGGGAGALPQLGQALADQPEIWEHRKQWRELPMTDGVALFTPEQQMKMHLLHYPIKLGDSAAYVRANVQWDVEVVQDDKVLHTYRHPKASMMTDASVMVKGFTAWDNKWVLETVDAKVIVGGENLNERLGHAEIFNFRMIKGKPFFFFVDGGKVRLSYDGQELPQQYDRVPHYGCCDSTSFNPRTNEQMVSFFGLRDGQWYHVDMGIYN